MGSPPAQTVLRILEIVTPHFLGQKLGALGHLGVRYSAHYMEEGFWPALFSPAVWLGPVSLPGSMTLQLNSLTPFQACFKLHVQFKVCLTNALVEVGIGG